MHPPSPVALLIIGVLLVIFFGKDKLEDTSRSFGKALRGFKEEISAVNQDTKISAEDLTINPKDLNIEIK
jgi:TatA/E family protein of Tat protein translocase